MTHDSLRFYTHEFRVAYHQTDGQRRVHHSNYLNYFEDARVEMLRAGGVQYKDIEDSGCLLVVTEMNVRYFAAAEFDDWLRLEVELTEIRKVRLRHRYEVFRDQLLIASAESTIASVGRDGRPKKLPQKFLDYARLAWPRDHQKPT
ncbi:acyl-CoA thioesterase [Roseiconus nitratireducens]|uniref:Acyl-CoA thioesterase n=1 Tax=Roseiconus nitratireducens TaxID=2605748 RepID=A0A5M6DB86_9BACT|nr:thioesterase family protein [Roseiconus nitratireducens]KAA5544633.1 acyl-CoA thioesterase [Roseiconus nitratireducens]